jgi:hypothetical protein
VSFNNGSLSGPRERTCNILVGGGCPVRNATVGSNVVYSDRHTVGIELGYAWGGANEDAAVTDNWIVGNLYVKEFGQLTLRGNTIVGSGTLVRYFAHPQEDAARRDWEDNAYHRLAGAGAAFFRGRGEVSTGATFDDWQRETGFDRRSSYAEAPPAGVEVIVRPNEYEPGRALVVVLNWERRPEVELDLSDVLSEGRAFQIVSVQDLHGSPLLTGTYHGENVRLPMKPVPPRPAIGWDSSHLPVTEPEFGVYLLLPE